MFIKSLMLFTVFIFAFEINTSTAKDKSYRCPCDCIELIEDAVDAVLETSFCDLLAHWESPTELKDQLESLKNWCNNPNKPLKSDATDIVEEMLGTIHKTIVGESHTLNGKTTVVREPAPDYAIKALLNLQNLLLYGSPNQIVKL